MKSWFSALSASSLFFGSLVQRKQLVYQVAGKGILDVRSEPFLHPALALLGHVQLAEEAQLGHAGPDLLVHCPTKVTNKSELVLLCVSLHDGAPGPHLGHHAAGAPHVDRGSVVSLPEQQLWRAVPKGDNSVRVAIFHLD